MQKSVIKYIFRHIQGINRSEYDENQDKAHNRITEIHVNAAIGAIYVNKSTTKDCFGACTY